MTPDSDLELFLLAEDIKKADPEELKKAIDLKARIWPPENEAAYLIGELKSADQALFVAEYCVSTMAKQCENHDIVDYWRKVCECIKPHASKN